MAVESKKNETSAEKSVKTEASKSEELVKVNGEGALSNSCVWGKIAMPLALRDVHNCIPSAVSQPARLQEPNFLLT